MLANVCHMDEPAPATAELHLVVDALCLAAALSQAVKVTLVVVDILQRLGDEGL